MKPGECIDEDYSIDSDSSSEEDDDRYHRHHYLEKKCRKYRTCFADMDCPGSQKCCNPASIIEWCKFNLTMEEGICTKPGGREMFWYCEYKF